MKSIENKIKLQAPGILGKSGASVIKVMAVMAIVMLGNVRVTKADTINFLAYPPTDPDYKVIMAPDNYPAFSELAEVANANAFTVNKWLNVFGYHAYDFSAGDVMTVFFRELTSGKVLPYNFEYVSTVGFNSAPHPAPLIFDLGNWGDRLTEQTWNAEMAGNQVGSGVQSYPNGFDPTGGNAGGNADYHDFTDGEYDGFNQHVFGALVARPAVPEPATMSLMLIGMAGLLIYRKRR